MSIFAEVIEVYEKNSMPTGGGSMKNWAGEFVDALDRGRRKRAILAIGGLDIGGYSNLISFTEGIELVGGSSDHTVVDVTDYSRELCTGDVLSFGARYPAMLYAFSCKHVNVEYKYDTD